MTPRNWACASASCRVDRRVGRVLGHVLDPLEEKLAVEEASDALNRFARRLQREQGVRLKLLLRGREAPFGIIQPADRANNRPIGSADRTGAPEGPVHNPRDIVRGSTPNSVVEGYTLAGP
jgi:hypothetical protein